ncbi:MAG: YggT family protein [Spirochaetota bacterium]
MTVVARILGGILSLYMILIFVRVLLTWFSGVYYGRPYEIIRSLTDPYLNYFRRFRFLQMGNVDFSPIAGILVLVVVLNILNRLAVYGTISVGLVLAIILNSLWSAVSFLITLFIVLIVIRFVAGLINANTVNPFIRTVDMIITPLLNWVHNTFFKRRFLTLQSGLAISGALLLVVSIAGNFLVYHLARLFQSLPF